MEPHGITFELQMPEGMDTSEVSDVSEVLELLEVLQHIFWILYFLNKGKPILILFPSLL
jgi:hypothetical protein